MRDALSAITAESEAGVAPQPSAEEGRPHGSDGRLEMSGAEEFMLDADFAAQVAEFLSDDEDDFEEEENDPDWDHPEENEPLPPPAKGPSKKK
jgi:hypothetical protein